MAHPSTFCERLYYVVLKNQRAISPQLSSLGPDGINKPYQQLHLKCLISSGPFGYRFKVGDTPDVGKSDQHYFELGLCHPWLLLPGD
jgi:hypothetical protein